MAIFKQLIKEFWLPFLLAIAWVVYNIYGSSPSADWSVPKIVNVFGPTFFLLSWLTGQFFRVKKHAKVENSFSVLEKRVGQLLDELESKTGDMIAHISGGSSFPLLMLGIHNHNTNSAQISVIHKGEHPLYDVSVRIVDLQKFQIANKSGRINESSLFEKTLDIGNLAPKIARTFGAWRLENDPEQSYNIFFLARNGGFTQLLRYKKINNSWVYATKVTSRNNDVLYEDIQKDYPKNPDGNICWD